MNKNYKVLLALSICVGQVQGSTKPVARQGAVKKTTVAQPGLKPGGLKPRTEVVLPTPVAVQEQSIKRSVEDVQRATEELVTLQEKAFALENLLQQQAADLAKKREIQSLARMINFIAQFQAYQETQVGVGSSLRQVMNSVKELIKSQSLFEKMKAFGSFDDLEQALQANLPAEEVEMSIKNAKKYWEQLVQQEALAQALTSTQDDDVVGLGDDDLRGEYVTVAAEAAEDDEDARGINFADLLDGGAADEDASGIDFADLLDGGAADEDASGIDFGDLGLDAEA